MRNKKGFTLIEVVVVTLIIAALALLVAPTFKNSTVTNDMEKAKMGLTEYTNAVKLYNEVHPNTQLSGYFNNHQFSRLTVDNTNDFVYLQHHQGRWAPAANSNFYTFLNLECIYRYDGGANDIVSRAMCYFPKYNEEEGKDCYWFTIYKNNPLVIKREEGDVCDAA